MRGPWVTLGGSVCRESERQRSGQGQTDTSAASSPEQGFPTPVTLCGAGHGWRPVSPVLVSLRSHLSS